MARSDWMKSDEGSESVKESVAMSPAFSDWRSVLRAMLGGVVSLVVKAVACVAELPAKSLTSAVMVRAPSLREERSRLESE